MGVWLEYEESKYDLTLDGLRINEALELERITGWTFSEFNAKRAEGSALAMKAGAYIAVKRQRPDLRFESFDFEFDQIERDNEDDEPDPTSDADESDPASTTES